MEFLELLENVGSNVKKLRKNLGYTQKEMSLHGIGQRHIQDIESGKGNLTLKTLWKLSRVFGIQIGELLKNSATPTPSYSDGIFEKLMPHLPVACIAWQFTKTVGGDFYTLKYSNPRAQELTHPELHVGKPISELFPQVEALGFVAFLNSARILNKSVCIDDFLYGDQRVNFGHFKVTAIPVSQDEVVVFFDLAT